MKNNRLILNLFGEEGVCAAEQTTCETENEVTEESVASDKEVQPAEIGEKRDDDLVSRIAALLSLDSTDEDSLIKAIKAKRARAELNERLRLRNAKKAYGALLSEAESLASGIKGFDLKRELSDKKFAAMLNAGFSIEEAWRAVHFDELMAAVKSNAEAAAVKKALDEIRSGQDRPEENGALGNAPVNSRTSVESLTGRGIRDILRRVENGAKIKF